MFIHCNRLRIHLVPKYKYDFQLFQLIDSVYANDIKK